jgi:hypothetical protein
MSSIFVLTYCFGVCVDSEYCLTYLSYGKGYVYIFYIVFDISVIRKGGGLVRRRECTYFAYSAYYWIY